MPKRLASTTSASDSEQSIKPVKGNKSRTKQTSIFNAKKAEKSTTFAKVKIQSENKPLPTRDDQNNLYFPDFPTFNPNLTPSQVLQLGSFGGTYFRPIYSKTTQQNYADQHLEYPDEWFKGLDIPKQVTKSVYNVKVNKFGVNCGGDLEMWESSGWMRDCDPYGWFQWYCRFYLGRRCDDDDRQVARGLGVFGTKGRWRNNLVNKCLKSGSVEKVVNDARISPKIRQLLQHWGYTLTIEDLQAAKERSGL